MHTGGNEEGILKWIDTVNNGDKWQEARVSVKHKEAFWVIMSFWFFPFKKNSIWLRSFFYILDVCEFFTFYF